MESREVIHIQILVETKANAKQITKPQNFSKEERQVKSDLSEKWEKTWALNTAGKKPSGMGSFTELQVQLNEVQMRALWKSASRGGRAPRKLVLTERSPAPSIPSDPQPSSLWPWLGASAH